MTSMITRVNGVLSFFAENCHAPWTVYAETALPALGMSLMMLLTPSPDEILEEFVQPAGLRSYGRWGRRIESSQKAKRSRGIVGAIDDIIPDVDSLIAHRIPGYRRIAYRPISNGVRHLWRIYNVAELVQYRWLLVDAVSTFVYAWAENLRESEPCEYQREAGFLSDPAARPIFGQYLDWIALYPSDNYIKWGDVEYHGGGRFSSTTSDITIIASASLQAYDPVRRFGVRIFDVTAGEVIDESMTTTPTDPRIGEYSAITIGTVPKGHIADVQYFRDLDLRAPRQIDGYLYNVTHTVYAGSVPKPDVKREPANPWPDYNFCDPWPPVPEPPPSSLDLPPGYR